MKKRILILALCLALAVVLGLFFWGRNGKNTAAVSESAAAIPEEAMAAGTPQPPVAEPGAEALERPAAEPGAEAQKEPGA